MHKTPLVAMGSFITDDDKSQGWYFLNITSKIHGIFQTNMLPNSYPLFWINQVQQ
jgi:hypothetical protein